MISFPEPIAGPGPPIPAEDVDHPCSGWPSPSVVFMLVVITSIVFLLRMVIAAVVFLLKMDVTSACS
jgi:hypothetical protein